MNLHFEPEVMVKLSKHHPNWHIYPPAGFYEVVHLQEDFVLTDALPAAGTELRLCRYQVPDGKLLVMRLFSLRGYYVVPASWDAGETEFREIPPAGAANKLYWKPETSEGGVIHVGSVLNTAIRSGGFSEFRAYQAPDETMPLLIGSAQHARIFVKIIDPALGIDLPPGNAVVRAEWMGVSLFRKELISYAKGLPA